MFFEDEDENEDEKEVFPRPQPTWQSLCYYTGMTNTAFISRNLTGIDPVALKADLVQANDKFNWIDGVLVATFMASFLGLVCLLAN